MLNSVLSFFGCKNDGEIEKQFNRIAAYNLLWICFFLVTYVASKISFYDINIRANEFFSPIIKSVEDWRKLLLNVSVVFISLVLSVLLSVLIDICTASNNVWNGWKEQLKILVGPSYALVAFLTIDNLAAFLISGMREYYKLLFSIIFLAMNLLLARQVGETLNQERLETNGIRQQAASWWVLTTLKGWRKKFESP